MIIIIILPFSFSSFCMRGTWWFSGWNSSSLKPNLIHRHTSIIYHIPLFIYIYNLYFYHATRIVLGSRKYTSTPDRSFSSSQPFTQDSNLQLEAGEGAIGQQRHLPLVFVVAPFVRVDCTDRATAQLICCYNSPCHTPLENFHGWLLNRKKFARKNKSKSRKSSEKHGKTDPWLRGRRRSIFQGGSDGDRTGPTVEPFHFREAMCVDSDDFENILDHKNSITTWDSKIIHGIPSNKFLGKTKSTCCYALVGTTTTSPFLVGCRIYQLVQPPNIRTILRIRKKNTVGVLSWEFLAISQFITDSTSR